MLRERALGRTNPERFFLSTLRFLFFFFFFTMTKRRDQRERKRGPESGNNKK